jgi:hypothetical protein
MNHRRGYRPKPLCAPCAGRRLDAACERTILTKYDMLEHCTLRLLMRGLCYRSRSRGGRPGTPLGRLISNYGKSSEVRFRPIADLPKWVTQHCKG